MEKLRMISGAAAPLTGLTPFSVPLHHLYMNNLACKKYFKLNYFYMNKNMIQNHYSAAGKVLLPEQLQ